MEICPRCADHVLRMLVRRPSRSRWGASTGASSWNRQTRCVYAHTGSRTPHCARAATDETPDFCPRSQDWASRMGYPCEKGYQNVSVQPMEQTAVFSVGLGNRWVSGITRQDSWEGLSNREALLISNEG